MSLLLGMCALGAHATGAEAQRAPKIERNAALADQQPQTGRLFVQFFGAQPVIASRSEGGSPGHSFMCISFYTSSTLKENCYGFYPAAESGVGLIYGPGVVLNEPNERSSLQERIVQEHGKRRRTATATTSFPITEEQRRVIMDKIAAWNNSQFSLTDQNCNFFLSDTAKAIGLPAPDAQSLERPHIFIERMNREINAVTGRRSSEFRGDRTRRQQAWSNYQNNKYVGLTTRSAAKFQRNTERFNAAATQNVQEAGRQIAIANQVGEANRRFQESVREAGGFNPHAPPTGEVRFGGTPSGGGTSTFTAGVPHDPGLPITGRPCASLFVLCTSAEVKRKP